MILLEYDKNKNAIINPNMMVEKQENFPKIGITCYSKKLLDSLIEKFNGEKIAELSSANGKTPIYKIKNDNIEIAAYMSKVGAPASVGDYEDVLEMGLEKLVVFGTCGILNKEIEDLSIIMPTYAIRDEGTSYHYIPETQEIEVNKKYKEEFRQLCSEYGYKIVEGKTWTTDAIYRETVNKMNKRREQGCVCVEMECSAMAAVSEFRKKDLFVFFYAADNLDTDNWDKRSLGNSDRLTEKEKIGLLAIELVKKMI